MKKHKGFTLIELLVVIAIIGLLSTLAVVALNNARQKSRDARRIADIKQIVTALELYFNDTNLYPIEAAAVTLGTSPNDCLDEDGLVDTCDAGGTTYMGQVPASPTPPTGYVYTYEISDGTTYDISFGLEGATGGLTCAAYTTTCCTATPTGFSCS
ncbi:MAG: type II secretion system protein [Patescibacteria group bacterium]